MHVAELARRLDEATPGECLHVEAHAENLDELDADELAREADAQADEELRAWLWSRRRVRSPRCNRRRF